MNYYGGYTMDAGIFSNLAIIDAKCPHCKSKLQYGETTSFDDSVGGHVCNTCEKPVS